MQTKLVNKWVLIWLFLGIPLLSAFVLRKSFNLGLYGDDWQHLYNMWRDFFVYNTKSFFDIRSYLNPYWPNYFYLGIINHFWGFYPPAYFIASYLLRVFANISLYFLTFELTKSKLASILATIFFLFSAAGLQTTDWVFNMNTYAGIGFLSIASVFYLKIRKLNTFRSWYYIAFILTFATALVIVPTRMHGAMPFLITMDLFLTFFAERKQLKITRYTVLRIVLAILVFAILSHYKSFGEGSYTSGRLNDSIKIIQQYTQRGYNDIWFYFLGILGHLVLPDNASVLIPLKTFAGVIIVVNSISIILGLIVSWALLKTWKLTPHLPIIVFNIIWTLILKWIVSLNTSPSSDVLFAIALGGQLLFWAIWIYYLTKNTYPNLSSTLIVSLIWIIFLTIIYWLFTPYYIIETTGRYMMMGAAGFAIFLGSLLSILVSEKLRTLLGFYLLVPMVMFTAWIGLNLQASQRYLGMMEQTRNRELTERTWNTLVKTVPILDPEGPSVFYFTTDNPVSLYGVLTFGFYMRAGMTYRIPVEHDTPLPCTDYSELLAYVKDGSPLQKIHGRKAEPVPLSRIFAFDFRNGQLVPITEQVRKKLVEDLKL